MLYVLLSAKSALDLPNDFGWNWQDWMKSTRRTHPFEAGLGRDSSLFLPLLQLPRRLCDDGRLYGPLSGGAWPTWVGEPSQTMISPPSEGISAALMSCVPSGEKLRKRIRSL